MDVPRERFSVFKHGGDVWGVGFSFASWKTSRFMVRVAPAEPGNGNLRLNIAQKLYTAWSGMVFGDSLEPYSKPTTLISTSQSVVHAWHCCSLASTASRSCRLVFWV